MWHSLFPTSQTHIAVSSSYNSPSESFNLSQSYMRFPRSAKLGNCWVRCLLSTGRIIDHGSAFINRSAYLRYLLVTVYQPLSLFQSNGLYHRFTYVHHISYLALTQLCGYQEGCPLTILAPSSRSLLHCQIGYFIHDPRFIL